jgi:hypothetical protein
MRSRHSGKRRKGGKQRNVKKDVFRLGSDFLNFCLVFPYTSRMDPKVEGDRRRRAAKRNLFEFRFIRRYKVQVDRSF